MHSVFQVPSACYEHVPMFPDASDFRNIKMHCVQRGMAILGPTCRQHILGVIRILEHTVTLCPREDIDSLDITGSQCSGTKLFKILHVISWGFCHFPENCKSSRSKFLHLNKLSKGLSFHSSCHRAPALSG